MKALFSDPQVRNALLMIDWGARRINLELDDDLPTTHWPAVDRAMQIAALRPHTLSSIGEGVVTDDAIQLGKGRFTPSEVAIRDAYDAFLDGLERFADYVSVGIVEVEDLEPYLRYWIRDVVSTNGSQDDMRWSLALLAYIDFYGFDGTIDLFSRFGHEIRVGKQCWNSISKSAGEWERTSLLVRTCQRA